MSFVYTWNATFLAQPADTEDSSLGAQRIRDTKAAVGERFVVDHSLAGDANDGKHNQVTLRPAAANPTSNGTDGFVFSKSVNGVVEFFYMDSAGNVTQLTSNGALITEVIGTVKWIAGNTLPAKYLWCNGQQVSRTTYSALYNQILTLYGAGDGNSTFNVPDLRGRSVFGPDNINGVGAAGRLTTDSLGTAATLGVTGGNEHVHQHSHILTITDPGHTHTFNEGFSYDSTDPGATTTREPAVAGQTGSATYPTNSATTGITGTNSNFGTGQSQNVPPMIILNPIIYAGV